MRPVQPRPAVYYRSTFAAELARQRIRALFERLAFFALLGALIMLSIELYRARRELRRMRAGFTQETRP